MKFLLLLALWSAPSLAAEVTCTHNDIYGFLGEFDFNTATGDYEITLPSDSVSTPGLNEAGLVSLKGRFEYCEASASDPVLAFCHVESAPTTITLPDGTKKQASLVINLNVEEVTVRSHSGLSVSRVGRLSLHSSQFQLKTNGHIDFGSPTNPPGGKADYCVAR